MEMAVLWCCGGVVGEGLLAQIIVQRELVSSLNSDLHSSITPQTAECGLVFSRKAFRPGQFPFH